MDYKIFDNKIIIAPNHRKSELMRIRQNNPTLNFKIISKEELIKNMCFSFDDRARLFLTRKGFRFDNTSEVIKSMFFLEDGIDKKIDELISLKQEMLNSNIIKINTAYQSFINSKQVLVYGYSKDDLELNKLLKNKEYYINTCQNEHSIYTFKQIEDEIRYLFENIFNLYFSGVALNKIKIVFQNDIYRNLLIKYQNFYSIHFNFQDDISYVNSEEYRDFKDMIKHMVVDQAFALAYDKYEDHYYLEKLLSHYLQVKDYILDSEIESYFDEIAKNIKIRKTRYEQGIDIISLSEAQEDDYVFILGFALNSFPTICKDDDYLSDKEKKLLNISTSIHLQNAKKEELKDNLNRLNHLMISFSEHYDEETNYLSLIAKELKMEIISNYEFKDTIYSKSHFNMMMGAIFDDEKNFSYISPYINSIDKNEIKYLKYDHKFKAINFKNDQSLKLSFTQVQTYFECGFKYYLTYILKASPFEDTISLKIGNLIHKMLENNVKGINKTFTQYLDEFDLSKRERVIISNLEEPINKAIDNINELCKVTSLKNQEAERNDFEYKIDSNAYLKGKVDLLMEGKNHYVIIDYKTSDYKFEPKKIDFGFSMQLPLYYILASSDKELSNKKLAGLYINNVLNEASRKNDYNYLLFKGLTLNEEYFPLIEGDKVFIKQNRSKNVAYDENEFNKLVEKTRLNLITVVNEIRKGNFAINPKVLKTDNLSCKFCPFADICYHDYKDNVYLKNNESEVE